MIIEGTYRNVIWHMDKCGHWWQRLIFVFTNKLDGVSKTIYVKLNDDDLISPNIRQGV